jgi:hypothetical protein
MTPLHLLLWDMLKNRTFKTNYALVDNLKKCIISEIAIIPPAKRAAALASTGRLVSLYHQAKLNQFQHPM